jgi:NADPH-dependent ferric siderophore reductase
VGVVRTTVRSAEPIGPHMRRIVVVLEDPDDFDPSAFTDSYVKVQLPPPGAGYGTDFDRERICAELPRAQWPRSRSITVRAWDPAAGALTLEFVCHQVDDPDEDGVTDRGDAGVAGPWAARAQPGDVLQIAGPGGGYTPLPDADWHLLVGDLCVRPAIAVARERIADDVPVFVIAPELPDGIEQEVRALDLPPGRGHAFVHGEADMVRAVRRHLILDRGMPEEDVHASGYWKQRRTDEEWRAYKAEWKRLAAEDVTPVLPAERC